MSDSNKTGMATADLIEKYVEVAVDLRSGQAETHSNQEQLLVEMRKLTDTRKDKRDLLKWAGKNPAIQLLILGAVLGILQYWGQERLVDAYLTALPIPVVETTND